MRTYVVLFLLQSASALFQSSRPPQFVTVATAASAVAVKPGATVSLFVDITPKPGIHVYAPGAKGYTPIALTLGRQAMVAIGKLTYPKSEIMTFESERVPVFKAPFRLTQNVTVGRAATAPLLVTATVDYQACDDTVCYKPESVPVSWTVKLAPGSGL